MPSADRWQVLITVRSFWEGGPEPLARLQQAGVEIVRPAREGPHRDDDLAAMLGEIDGIIAGVDHIGPQALTRGHPRLKVIARNGVGVDTIDIATATHLGIVVTNAPGTNTEAVADLVFALMFSLARHIREVDEMARRGRWARVLGRELFQKTLGVIGFGQIGRAVARRAAGFAMRVLATDPAVDEATASAHRVELTSLERVLEEADFVTVHVPLAPSTRHLIREAELRRMQPSAYLINTARGGVVDEAALARALREGWIAGAACDVFEHEPPTGSPLLEAPRLILTPHIGAHTYEAVTRGALLAVENLLAVRNGRPAPNIVNPEVYRRQPAQ